MLALGMEEVHGPAEVINGIPLNVATPFSSVKRFCNTEKSLIKYMQKPKATYSRLNRNPTLFFGRKEEKRKGNKRF